MIHDNYYYYIIYCDCANIFVYYKLDFPLLITSSLQASGFERHVQDSPKRLVHYTGRYTVRRNKYPETHISLI